MENTNLTALALTLGYHSATQVNRLEDIEKHLSDIKNGLHMIVLDVNAPDIDLPRPILKILQYLRTFYLFK